MNDLNLPKYMIVTLKVTAGFFVLILVLKVCDQRDNSDGMKLARSLLDQSSKWYSISLQDKQAFFSFQHANYAIAYLNAARHIASDVMLERMSGTDIHKLYNKMEAHQFTVTKQMVGKHKGKDMHAQPSWIS